MNTTQKKWFDELNIMSLEDRIKEREKAEDEIKFINNKMEMLRKDMYIAELRIFIHHLFDLYKISSNSFDELLKKIAQ